MSNVEELLRRLIALCDKRDIPYAIIGGWAVRAYGVPRPTYDVDLTVALDRDQLPGFLDAIDDIGYDVDEPYRRGWTDQVAGMPLIKTKTFIDGRTLTGDIFLAENAFQHSLMARRVIAKVDDLDAWIVTAEDLVLMKLVANRPRDKADVFDIFFMQGQLDEAYLRDWAGKLGVSAELERALQEARQE